MDYNGVKETLPLYIFEVVFPLEERKASFSNHIEAVRRRFEAASGVQGSKMNNSDLPCAILHYCSDPGRGTGKRSILEEVPRSPDLDLTLGSS